MLYRCLLWYVLQTWILLQEGGTLLIELFFSTNFPPIGVILITPYVNTNMLDDT